jgi:hypothetical protein
MAAQQAIPPQRYREETRKRSTCECGQPIKTSGFGWVHTANSWVRHDRCSSARPRAAVRKRP